MPELPEVETVKRGLAPIIEGRVIAQVELRREGLRWPFPERMAERLRGARVEALRRRSKYLLAELDTRETLIVHLGMSGRVRIEHAAIGNFEANLEHLEKHDHVIFAMEAGDIITFNDPRRFGAMDLAPSDAIARHPLLARIGPEPLGNLFNEGYLRAAIARRRAPIKALLLDQRIVAGIGNIYACEALFRAGIDPRRAGGRIAPIRIAALTRALREVLLEAIEAGGASLRDHRQTNGEMGYFQHSFRVYGRADEDCLRDGCKGKIARIVQSGRSTFACLQCQR